MATPSFVPLNFATKYSGSDAGMLHQASIADGYKPIILAAAQQYGLQPSVICGIASRESAWGLTLTPPGPVGTGDFKHRVNPKPFRPGVLPPDNQGFGRGLMQIDFDAFDFARTGNWQDPDANINFGCQVLHDALAFIRLKTSLQGLMQMRAAIAAYNCGPGNVLKVIQQGQDIDQRTANYNYSADVVSRAGFFQGQGWA